jgi:Ca2+-dependent lipid-binding protein
MSPNVQLALMLRPTKLLPAIPVRVVLRHLSVSGRCCVVLTLTPERAPGVSSAAVSFARPPQLDFDLVPFGLPVTDLPFLLDMLKVRKNPLQFWCKYSASSQMHAFAVQ